MKEGYLNYLLEIREEKKKKKSFHASCDAEH